MSKLRIGLACLDMDLPVGLNLTGYIGRHSGAKGINDHLQIKCIVFDDDAKKVILVSCELLALSTAFIDEVLELAEEKTMVLAENIVIMCTHTHSGPASIFLQDCGDVDNNWLSELKQKIVNCIEKAMNDLLPSYITYQTGKCNITINRVQNRNCGEKDSKGWESALREGETAETVVTPELQGTQIVDDQINMLSAHNVDEQVGVLAIHNIDDHKLRCLVVNYACHPVTLEYTNYLYSGDFPHYMEEDLLSKFKDLNSNFFINGCCGDLNPFERGNFEEAKRIGVKLADSVMKIVKESRSKKYSLDLLLSCKTISVNIPLKHNLDKEKLNKMKVDYREKAAEIYNEDNSSILVNIWKAYEHWAENMLQKLENGKLENYITAKVKLVRIGELMLVTLPFEAFHEIGFRIKECLGQENTIVACYANGDYGYMPSKKQYAKAKYEVEDAFKFYGFPGPVAENAEDIILDAITKY